MARIKEIPSDASFRSDITVSDTNSTSRSNEDANDTDDMISDDSRDVELSEPSTAYLVPSHITGQAVVSSRNTIAATQNGEEEYDSISAAPIRRIERNARPPSSIIVPSGTSSMMVEPPSEVVNTDIFRAALLIVDFRQTRVIGETPPEPPSVASYLAALRREPPQVHPEAQAAIAENGGTEPSKPKRRKRNRPRLTRVKNERAKRAKARADAARAANRPRPEFIVGSSSTPTREQAILPVDVGPSMRRLTRAAARALRSGEAPRPAGQERRRNKGKGKAKDSPDSEDVATNVKRKREEEDEGDDLDEQQTNVDPGPSRPTRRTRRRVDIPVEENPPVPSEAPSATTNGRQLRPRAAVPNARAQVRGTRQHRSLAPEPSEGRIQAARRRARLDTPEAELAPVASSSRVSLEDLARSEADADIPDPSVKPEETDQGRPLGDGDEPLIAEDAQDSVPVEADTTGSHEESPDDLVPYLQQTYGIDHLPQTIEEVNQFLAAQGEQEPSDNFRFVEAEPPVIERSEPTPSSVSLPPSATDGLERIPTRPRSNRVQRQETTILNRKVYRPGGRYWR